LTPDPQYALILENLAEINACLRILDEANARLEAAVECQLELLEILMTQRGQLFTSTPNQQSLPGNGSRPRRGSQTVNTQTDRITDRDTEYSRTTHPALFKVIDLLEQDEKAGGVVSAPVGSADGCWQVLVRHRETLRVEGRICLSGVQ
jgi:hypothetical protein